MPQRQRMTFIQWIVKVDDLIYERCPLGTALPLLPECTYKGWYDAGYTPSRAAKRAIKLAV